jgi:hypothetical protein
MGGEGELIFALPTPGMPIWRMKSRRKVEQTNTIASKQSRCEMH